MGKNTQALNEKNSNEEQVGGVLAIQIVLAMDICLPNIAYRIYAETTAMASSSTNPQSHCCDFY